MAGKPISAGAELLLDTGVYIDVLQGRTPTGTAPMFDILVFERQRILAATAVDRLRFCVCVGELEYDDPFSMIISFDGTQSQPWERFDIRRELTGLVPIGRDPSGKGNLYCALSNEGDVYFLGGGQTHRDKILGAGIQSDDANGLGAMFAIAEIDNVLFAAGEGNQIYVRQSDSTWKAVPSTKPGPGERYKAASFGSINGTSKAGTYVAGLAYPRDDYLRELASKNFETWDEADEALNNALKARKVPPTPVPFCLYSRNTDWRPLEFQDDEIVSSIFIESPSKVWMVGTGGLILFGNAEEGFRNVSFHGDRNKNLLSITKFKNQIIIASDYALHRFDGHLLSPLKPKINPFINRNIPTPLKVQAVDDVMFYFDYKHGVHRWDGETWEEIVIPPELLERKFKGLPLGK